MRSIKIFILLLFSNFSFGQNKDSAFIVLTAKKYLTMMYIENNFDKACQYWDTLATVETYNHNSYYKIEFPNTLKKIKNNFEQNHKKGSIFILQDQFKLTEMQIEGNTKQIFLYYYYANSKENLIDLSNGILIFRSYDFGNSWKLIDIDMTISRDR